MSIQKHASTRSEPALTPESRIVYCFLHERRTKDGQGKPLDPPRHECTILIPKLHNDPAQCPNYAMLARLCMEACNKQVAFGYNFPQGGHWPIKDGDAPPKPKLAPPGSPQQAPDANKYAYQKGHWVINAGSVLEPGPRVCVMQGGQAIEIPAKVIAGKVMYKSGDFGHASIQAYTYHNQTYGVKFSLEGVLFTREGEAIGGQGGPRAAAAMFGGIAPVSATPMPGGSPHPNAPASAGFPTPGAPVHAPSAPTPGYHVPPGSNGAPAPQYSAPPTAPYVPQNPAPPPPPINPNPAPPPPPPATGPTLPAFPPPR